MRYKRLGLFAATLALVVSAFSGLTFAPHAYAAGQTCTWTGTAGDNKFSTAGNWTGCGGGAPQAGDTIAIDLATITDQQQLQNDLGVALGGVVFSSSDNVYKGLGISSLTLADGAEIAKNASSLSSGIIIGSIADSTTSDIIANGSMTLGVDLSYKNIKASGVFTDNTLNYSYSEGDTFTKLVVGPDAGQVNFSPSNATPATITFPIEYNANASTAHLSFGGYCAQYTPNAMGCDVWAPIVWNLSGQMTLNAPMQVDGGFGSSIVTVNFTGQVSDPAKITKLVGANITLNVGSTVVVDPVKTTNYAGVKNSEYIQVANNETAVVADGAVRSSVWVYKGGTMKGKGSFVHGIHIDAGGVIAPGMSPGCLTADTLNLYGTYEFEIGGATACTTYDQIKILGKNLSQGQTALDVSNATLVTSRYNGYTPKKGETYVIIENQSSQAVEGTFKDLPEGATFEQNGIVFKISYTGGDGNDVTLTVMNTPVAPDTGFQLIQSNAPLAGGLIIALGGALFMMTRRLKTARR